MDIKAIRATTGLSREGFARIIGASSASVARWEKGEVNPNPKAIKSVQRVKDAIDNGTLPDLIETAYAKTSENNTNTSMTFNYGVERHEAIPSPYVRNCQEDQTDFYNELISLQQHESSPIPWNIYQTRISMIESIDGVRTSQYNLERPKPTAKSWTANMGPHGWHRYVGRFPAQLVRAVLNHYCVDKDSTVLDPFCGSGTTLVESRLLGAKSIGIEISPLSAMLCRAKCQFPTSGDSIHNLCDDYRAFYNERYESFMQCSSLSYVEILNREGNLISKFANIERWYTEEALLGTSITVEFINTLDGYMQDVMALALSACMRSIGNVDVDVVRAEYSKKPRENVDVLTKVARKLTSIANAIDNTVRTHEATISSAHTSKVILGDCRIVEIDDESIDLIITSPPYGTESLSYLRTHLLSFRSLEPILGVDPYNFGDGVIGSEYLGNESSIVTTAELGTSYSSFFSQFTDTEGKLRKRVASMSQFFVDMNEVIKLMRKWVKSQGHVVFVIGNKRIGDVLIPTSDIVTEMFANHGFVLERSINHKLKTNNSNSQVPWQSRIIDDEYILFFRKAV